MEQAVSRSRITPFVLWYGLGAVFLGLCLTPLFDAFPSSPARTLLPHPVMRLVLLALSPVGVWLALRTAPISSEERRFAWALCLASAALCEVVHYWAVDRAHYFATQDNTAWQIWMHGGILALDPNFLPHSYRFLPDCIVEIFRWLCGDFELSRFFYRMLADSLLFAAVFRYARVYLGGLASSVVVLLIVMVYPVTILRYAGQFVDPASHLSFAVCLYCLAAGYEPGFGPSLFLGIFAKESVVVMALCRAFYGSNRRRSVMLAAVYFGVAVGVAAGIRLVVNEGSFSYGKVSGVQWDHIWMNLGMYREWAPLYIVSLGVFIPGAVLAWRLVDRSLRATAIVLTGGLIISSLVFSWLAEVRNLVPAFLPLAVASLKYVEVHVLGKTPTTIRGVPQSAKS